MQCLLMYLFLLLYPFKENGSYFFCYGISLKRMEASNHFCEGSSGVIKISVVSMRPRDPIHRNQTISRKGANIISRRPSHGHLARWCCPQVFLRIFSEVTYIRTVGNSSLLKIYTLPNHTITIGVCILETQLLGLLYGGGAIVLCRNGPCRGCLLIYRTLFYIV
jgi:hypothetical protein